MLKQENLFFTNFAIQLMTLIISKELS